MLPVSRNDQDQYNMGTCQHHIVKGTVHEGSGSINVLLRIHCVGHHWWFSSLSLFSVLNLSKCYFKVIIIVILMMYMVSLFSSFLFWLSCYTMSKTCDHFTASGKHVWVRVCECVCAWMCPCYLHFKIWVQPCIVNIYSMTLSVPADQTS